MSTPVNYIKTYLQEAIEIFKGISLKLYSDVLDNDYFVVVEPSEMRSSGDFLEIEDRMIDDFYAQFPYDGLSFVTQETVDLIGILKLVSVYKTTTFSKRISSQEVSRVNRSPLSTNQKGFSGWELQYGLSNLPNSYTIAA